MQEDEPDEDAENAGKGGCGLGGNLDVALCRADWHLHRGEYQVAAITCCFDNLGHAFLLCLLSKEHLLLKQALSNARHCALLTALA